MRLGVLVFLGLATVGCASKYAVTFDSYPQGATLICDGTNWGYTPKTLYYDKEVKKQSYLNLYSCSANWSSGARENYGTIPIYKFPDGVQKTLQRPDVPGFQQDAEFALKFQQMRQQQRQAQAAANAESWRQLNQSLDNLNQSLQQQTNSLQQQLNSQSYSQPSFNYNNNRNYGTPVYNASDCKGSVVNGKCYGAVVPSGVQKKCYGTMLNGECIGTVGY